MSLCLQQSRAVHEWTINSLQISLCWSCSSLTLFMTEQQSQKQTALSRLPKTRFPFALSIFIVNVTLLCLKAACKKSIKVSIKGTHSCRDPPSRRHHQPGQNAFSIYSYECECLVQYFHFFFLWLSCVCGVILWDFFLINGMTRVR